MEHNKHQLLGSLRQALMQQWQSGGAWAHISLEPLPSKGLAHEHVRLIGTGWLARIPIQSQMQWSASDNLIYQKTCFDRASIAGHAPTCVHVLQPSAELPRGALIVKEIDGRSAHLLQDLHLIARSMAALHRLPLPQAHQCAPLIHADDPLQAMFDEISVQARYLPQAALAPTVASHVHRELSHFQALCQSSKRPMRRLIAFDGHPGNFVITKRSDGHETAYLVDLEKCRYSYPGFDLAHATLYTSTTWDVDSSTILQPSEVLQTYRHWASHVDEALALDAQRWHLPLRRAMWLWSVTWCAKWRVTSPAQAAHAADGEDWSAQNIDASLAAHVRERVDHYLSEAGVSWVLDEFAQLELALPSSVA